MFAAFIMIGTLGPFVAGPFDTEAEATSWLADRLVDFDPKHWNEAKYAGPEPAMSDAETLEEYQNGLKGLDFAHVYEMKTPAAAAAVMREFAEV